MPKSSWGWAGNGQQEDSGHWKVEVVRKINEF
jgi:hypothetical protein